MQVDITPRNYAPTIQVRHSIEDRAEKLLKYLDVSRVRYTLTAESVHQICEVHVHVRGKDFHSKATSEEMLNSVDKASAAMEKQLRRHKRKRDDSKKARFETPGIRSAAALEAAIEGEADTAEEVDEEL